MNPSILITLAQILQGTEINRMTKISNQLNCWVRLPIFLTTLE